MPRKKGRFIVIDGGDGSGKGTQAELLCKNLKKKGYKVKLADFPQYGEKSAALVEEYLNGKFGEAAEVGPYRASVFYAVDRYSASRDISKWLKEGGMVISNRYVSANKGHQTGKIKDKAERKKFIDWLNHFEYELFKIPVPDLTIFLHVPSEIGYQLVLKKEAREYTKGKKQDIHEADSEHLKNAENAYLEMVDGSDQYDNWLKINCIKDKKLMSIEEIQAVILETVISEDTFIKNKKQGTGLNHVKLNVLIDEVMSQARKKGFGSKLEEVNIPEKIALLHSEVSEAYGAFKEGNLEGRHGFHEEIGDAFQRAAHMAGVFDIKFNKIKKQGRKLNPSVESCINDLHEKISIAYESYRQKEVDNFKKHLSQLILDFIAFSEAQHFKLEEKVYEKLEINEERVWDKEKLEETLI
jgi:dTMP kinase